MTAITEAAPKDAPKNTTAPITEDAPKNTTAPMTEDAPKDAVVTQPEIAIDEEDYSTTDDESEDDHYEGCGCEEDDDDDDDRNTILRGKWMLDGASTLDEVIERLEDRILAVRALKAKGWRLTNTIDDDYGFLKLGTPPPPPPKAWWKRHRIGADTQKSLVLVAFSLAVSWVLWP